MDKKEKLMPELRFKEFEGEWNNIKLGSLGKFQGGGTPSTQKEEYWKGTTPWISSSDLREDDILNLNVSRYLTDTAITESATKIIPANSVLFVSRVGVGKLAVNTVPICTSQDFSNMVITKDSSYYIAYYFLARNKLLHAYSQGTSIKGFTTGDLKSIPINIPPLPEQQKIAGFLSTVDQKIKQLQRKKELLAQYKKGMMQKLFSQEIRFKDEQGNDFPEWEHGNFVKYIRLYRGSSPRPIIKYITNNEQGVNWIKIGDTKNSKDYIIRSVSEKITEEGAKKSRFVSKGELILANSMSFGKTYMLGLDGYIYDGWFVLREFDNDFHKQFLMQILNSEFIQKQYYRLSAGGVVQNISSEIVYSTTLLKPTINEQQKIADFLSALDGKVAQVGKQIEHAQRFKKGLLQKMFV